MGDFIVDNDPDNKMLNSESNSSVSNINLKQDDTMLGVELLANPSKSKADLSVTDNISGGYSSGYSSAGEESIKSDKNITINAYYDFLSKKDDEIKEIERQIKLYQ